MQLKAQLLQSSNWKTGTFKTCFKKRDLAHTDFRNGQISGNHISVLRCEPYTTVNLLSTGFQFRSVSSEFDVADLMEDKKSSRIDIAAI